MGRKKRRFIEKDKSVSFKLVSRSQDDPLFFDESAPSYILVEKKSKEVFPLDLSDDDGQEDFKRKNKNLSTEERKAEQKKFGVYYDDDYDYLQHLVDVEELPKSSTIGISLQHLKHSKDDDGLHDLPALEELDENEKDADVPSTSKGISDQKSKKVPSIMLPSSVFESNLREKEDLAKRAALPVGPQLDWDPDIVEAMCDDFDFTDPENLMEDDFVIQAMQEQDDAEATYNDEVVDQYKYDFNYKQMRLMTQEDNQDIAAEEDLDDLGDNLSLCGYASSDNDDKSSYDDEARDQFPPQLDQDKIKQMMSKKNFKRFFGLEDPSGGDDELDRMTINSGTSTHFTEYSMSSSVVQRNENLKQLDRTFEQMFIREYADEDAIGALDGDNEAEQVDDGDPINPAESTLMATLVEEYQEAKRANFGMQYERNEDATDYVRRKFCKIQLHDDQSEVKKKDETESYSSSSSDTECEEIEIVDPGRKGDKERYDCESILSTYSNTQYHPKMLRDTDRYGNLLIKHKNHLLGESKSLSRDEIGTLESDHNDAHTTCSRTSRLTELSFRPKHETAEEKRTRKKELKEYRAMRRAEKKANKLTFTEEKIRMQKNELNTAVQKKIAIV